MSTHNICFRGEIRKILCGYPLLTVAMTGLSVPILWVISVKRRGSIAPDKIRF